MLVSSEGKVVELPPDEPLQKGGGSPVGGGVRGEPMGQPPYLFGTPPFPYTKPNEGQV